MPTYSGNLADAEKKLKEEIESNGEFRVFLEVCLDPLGRAMGRWRLTLLCFSLSNAPDIRTM